MSLFALGLLLCSAIIHMGWNLLVKQAGDRYIVTWWALAFGAVCFSAFPLAAQEDLRQVWGISLVSACFQFAYYMLLNFAYKSGDFSLVYPIARGTAPIFIALWSMLFLAERVPWVGIAGLSMIILGIVLIGGGAWKQRGRQGTMPGDSIVPMVPCSPATLQRRLPAVAPFLIALCISGYSVIDGAAVKHTSAFPYTVLTFSFNVLLLAPVVWLRYGRSRMVAVGRQNWWQIALIGVGVYTAYGLVLAAYALAPVSYVGAVREVSIVLAALAGWLWLGESFGLARTVGSLVVCAGILLVTVAG